MLVVFFNTNVVFLNRCFRISSDVFFPLFLICIFLLLLLLLLFHLRAPSFNIAPIQSIHFSDSFRSRFRLSSDSVLYSDSVPLLP